MMCYVQLFQKTVCWHSNASVSSWLKRHGILNNRKLQQEQAGHEMQPAKSYLPKFPRLPFFFSVVKPIRRGGKEGAMRQVHSTTSATRNNLLAMLAIVNANFRCAGTS